ncbi:unnamed protein product [Pylaiella littoralis]
MCSFATLKAAMLLVKSRFGFADEGRDRGPLLARKKSHACTAEGRYGEMGDSQPPATAMGDKQRRVILRINPGYGCDRCGMEFVSHRNGKIHFAARQSSREAGPLKPSIPRYDHDGNNGIDSSGWAPAGSSTADGACGETAQRRPWTRAQCRRTRRESSKGVLQMDSTSVPSAKRARKSSMGTKRTMAEEGNGARVERRQQHQQQEHQHQHQQGQQDEREPKEEELDGPHAPEGRKVGAAPAETPVFRSMTARPSGATSHDEEDTLFGAPVIGPELPRLRGVPPSTSDEAAVLLLWEHAKRSPETIRDRVKDLAKELATAAGCPHGPELVTFSQNKRAARTCGQHQAHVLAALNMQARLLPASRRDRYSRKSAGV